MVVYIIYASIIHGETYRIINYQVKRPGHMVVKHWRMIFVLILQKRPIGTLNLIYCSL